MKQLKELGLIKGKGALPKGLLKCCHQGRLVGGLSISLRATPDEVVGGVTHEMNVKGFKVFDVRTTKPMVMEIAWKDLVEKWEVEDVEGLVHNLNDLFREEPGAKLLVVLGEWEDMLQLWALDREVLKKLLDGRLLDDARNAVALRRLFEDRE
jgi:hypothetical protein